MKIVSFTETAKADLTLQYKIALPEDKVLGLCEKRFAADGYFDGDRLEISVGDTIFVGGAELRVTSIKQKCYPNCEITGKDIPCSLKNNVYFCDIIAQGEITPGDELKIQKNSDA